MSLSVFHIPGIKNATADFRSPRPRDSYEAYIEEEAPTKLSLGVRTVRAEREMIADVDPRIERLARIGDADPSYKVLIHHVENRTDINLLEENSELRKIGVAGKELAIFTCKNGFKLVVGNKIELYIPAMARK